MEKEIINRVDQSGLTEINLEDFYPKGERVLIDVKENLFQGLILKEKDFREFVKNENGQVTEMILYQNGIEPRGKKIK